MEIRGVVKRLNYPILELKLKDDVDVDELKKYAVKGHIYGVFEPVNMETTTDLQRKHFYALCGDYSAYTGVPIEEAESWFKVQFMIDEQLEELPSLKRSGVSKQCTSRLLEYMITYMIQNDIPFRKQQFYLTTDQSKMLYALTMKRLCWVCGKPYSDLHHATNLVGMGRKRSGHEHVNSKFMCLCRKHHQEVHQIGLSEFRDKHHLKEINLGNDDLTKLGVK